MRTSPTLTAYAVAMCAAAPGLHDPRKDRRADGAPSRHRYANLSDFVGEIRDHLASHGLTVIQGHDLARTTIAPWVVERKGQPTVTGEGPVAPLVTRILHISGEWVETDTPCAIWHDPQDQGKAITYAARYALLRALAMASVDDDDDGQSSKDKRKGKETVAAKEDRQAQHDPDWEGSRGKFCAALTTEGLTYEQVAGWLDSQGIGNPSTIGKDGRRALFLDVRKGGGRRMELDEWLAREAS